MSDVEEFLSTTEDMSDAEAIEAMLAYAKAEKLDLGFGGEQIEREPTLFEQAATGAQNFGAAGLSVFADMVDAAGVVMGIVESTGEDELSMEFGPATALSTAMRDAIEGQRIDNLPPEAENFVTGPVASGFGSAGGFIAAGSIGKALGVGQTLATAAAGSASGGVQEFFSARAGGASEERQLASFLVGAGVGSAEAIPLGNLFARVNRTSGGALSRVLISGAMEAGEEALQEGVQQVASNIIARHISQVDEDRELLEGVLESAAVGAIVGGTLGGTLQSAVETARVLAPAEQENGQPTEAPSEPQPTDRQEDTPQDPISPEELPATDEATTQLTPPGVAAADESDLTGGALEGVAESGENLEVAEIGQSEAPVDAVDQEPLGDPEAELETEARLAETSGVAVPETEEEVAQWAADRGVEVEFVDDGPAKGVYEDGKIILQRGDDMRAVARHELVHHLATGSETEQAQYRALEADLRGALGEEVFEAVRSDYLRRRAEAGLPGVTSEALADEEAVATSAELLTGYLDFFAENPERLEAYVRGDRTRGQRFVDWLKGLLRRVGIQIPTSLERLAQGIQADAELTEVEQGLPADAAIRSAVAIGNALDSLLGSRPAPRSAVTGKRLAVPAFHGTPHDFDKFSTDKIGTGEGAQAFGWGLYFAGQREIAEHYRRALSREDREVWIDGKFAFKNAAFSETAENRAAYMIAVNGGVDGALRAYEQTQDRLNYPAHLNPVADAIRSLAGRVEVRVPRKGSVFQVTLAPDEDEYLLWDEPLSAQSEKVRDALDRLAQVPEGAAPEDADPEYQAAPGSVLYADLSAQEGSDRAVSKRLLAAGIRGIKYLDGSSRGKGEGSYNYVIFDDADVQIDARFSPAGRAQAAVPQAAQESGVPEPEAPLMGRIGAALGEKWSPVSEVVADAYRPVEELGIAELTESLRLMRGKAQAAVEGPIRRELKKLEPLLADPAMSRESVRGMTALEVYLYVSHAPERNEVVRKAWERSNAENERLAQQHEAAGRKEQAEKVRRRIKEPPTDGSGISTGTARRALAGYNRGKDAAKFQEARDIVKRINDWKLDTWKSSGLVSSEVVDRLRSTYQWYVPLRHIEEDSLLFGVGRGVDIRGAEFRRAQGRQSLPEHILAHVIADTTRAAVRAEKAKVGQQFADIAEGLDDFEVDPVEVRLEIGKDGVAREVPVQANVNSPDVLAVRIDGEAHVVEGRTDAAKRVIRSLNESNVLRWPDALQPVARFAGAILRGGGAWPGLTKLNTSLNPGFVPVNFVRDHVQGAFFGKSFGVEAQDLLSPRKVTSAARVLTQTFREIEAGQEVSDPVAREWIEEGGPVAFLDRTGLDQAVSEINRMASGKSKADRALDYARRVGWGFELANRVAENVVRFNAYRAMRENGTKASTAALNSKDISVNFERRGTSAPIFGVFYMFANAGIQGNSLVLRMLRHPRVRRALVAYTASAAIMAIWNRYMAGTDDEGEPLWDKVNSWDKTNNFMVYIPWVSDQPFKIPLPYGLNVLHAVPTFTMDAIFGGQTPSEAFSSITEAGVNAFNPFGGDANIQDVLTPDQLDPFFQVQDNRAWWGGAIHPETRGVPDSQKAWDDTLPFWKGMAEKLNAATGGDEFEPGAIDVSPESIEYLFDQALGGTGKFIERSANFATNPAARDASNTPVLRRFFGASYDRADRESFYELKDKIMADHRRKEAGKGGDHPLSKFREPLRNVEKQLRKLKAKRKGATDEDRSLIREQELELMRRFSARVRRQS